MTNPYQGFEYKMSIGDLPGEEQIVPADPATLKGLMEVWRDTANQLNAERLIKEEARHETARAYEEYQKELDAKLKLEGELKKEKELKDLAIQELNGFKEQSQKQLEKLRRHRDELAGKVKQARATRIEIDGFLEAFDGEDSTPEPIDFLRDIAGLLERDLGVQEDSDEAN